MSGVAGSLFAARIFVNCGPNAYATKNAAGILSRLNRLKTAPLRKPLKTSRTMVTRKRKSIILNGPIIYVFPPNNDGFLTRVANSRCRFFRVLPTVAGGRKAGYL